MCGYAFGALCCYPCAIMLNVPIYRATCCTPSVLFLDVIFKLTTSQTVLVQSSSSCLSSVTCFPYYVVCVQFDQSGKKNLLICLYIVKIQLHFNIYLNLINQKEQKKKGKNKKRKNLIAQNKIFTSVINNSQECVLNGLSVSFAL